MIEIGQAVREGAMAFLAREYKVLSIFVIAVGNSVVFRQFSRAPDWLQFHLLLVHFAAHWPDFLACVLPPGQYIEQLRQHGRVLMPH